MDIDGKITRLIKLVQEAQRLKNDKTKVINTVITTPEIKIFNIHDIGNSEKHNKIVEKLSNQIEDFNITLDGLNQLKNITGMREIKEDFLNFINTTVLFGNPRKDKCGAIMIQGDPGCGKTTVSRILAMIIYGIGFLRIRKEVKKDEDKKPVSKDISFAIVNHIYEKNIQDKDLKIKEFEKIILDMKEDLQETINVNNKIKNIHTDLSKYSRFITEKQKNEMQEYVERNSKTLTKISDSIKDIQPVESKLDPQTKTSAKKEIKLLPNEKVEEEVTITEADYIIYAKKNDIVGEYIGHTPTKVARLLESAENKVIIFDECYNIVIFEKTDFGLEAINMINEGITSSKYNFFAIFIGYKKLIEENLFDKQPGLKSRIDKIFVIKSYTHVELLEIFKINLGKLEIDPTIDLLIFFEKNIKAFPQYGRDVIKFIEKYIKYIYASQYIESLLDDNIMEIKENYVSKEMFYKAFDQYRHNCNINHEDDYLFYII